ncbi:C10 family peptidase [Sphingobacterium sp. Lzh-3]|uniref:C10 family peptidase n=1 Tax=Sphingobacterium TaxID=28453 RepID=UPI0039857058
MESEIKANSPVILTGYTTNVESTYPDGHCWVTDGIHKVITCPEALPDGSTIGGWGFLWFHINWG